MGDLIQGLWIGGRLSAMEMLSIRSFLAHGHEYVLYTYEPVENLPAGAQERDASAILPVSSIFQYTDHASFAGFSNFFRYKLLLEYGGWWADTDVICLKPFDFTTPFVFASEITAGGAVPTSAVLNAPPGSEAMARAWQVCLEKNPRLLKWGETGPKLVAEIIALFSLDRFLLPPTAFCPVSCHDWHRLFRPDSGIEICRHSYAIHLWNEMWRRGGGDKDRLYDPGSLYGCLQQRYLELPFTREENEICRLQ
jgi:hypothetical protein